MGGTRARDLPTCPRQTLCREPGKSHSPALGHWPGLGLTSRCSLVGEGYTERGQTWLWGRGTHGSTLKLHGGSRYWEQDAAMFPGIRKDTNKKPVVPASCPQAQGRLNPVPSKSFPNSTGLEKAGSSRNVRGLTLTCTFQYKGRCPTLRTGVGFLSHRC